MSVSYAQAGAGGTQPGRLIADERQGAVRRREPAELCALARQRERDRIEHQYFGRMREQAPGREAGGGGRELPRGFPAAVARGAIERAVELVVELVQPQLERRNRGPGV